jgi:RHS repeat-associated protein
VTERQAAAGQTPKRMKERIYLGGFEIYREYENDGDTVTLERETLHIMDDKQRIALVETRTQGSDPAPVQLVRYQFGNHLGSASLELDDGAQIISYEEYYPYGSTSYQAGRSSTETPKRYRYSGKERDEETGFAYYGLRYYAFGLGRWTSADPASLRDGLNLYRFTRTNPVALVDPVGTDSDSWASPSPPSSAPPKAGPPKLGPFIRGTFEGLLLGAEAVKKIIPMEDDIGQPVIAGPISAHRVALEGSVALGLMSKSEASKDFRAFIEKQVYSDQLSLGGDGYCLCATRQMALKFAGIILLEQKYGEIKDGLRSETSPAFPKGDGSWEKNHFNRNFSNPWRQHPDAIAQVARNPNVGTGSTERLRWTRLSSTQARLYLDEGAMIAVGVGWHWMTAVHDPFVNKDLIVDPMAGRHSYGRIVEVTPSKSTRYPASMTHPHWGEINEYYGLARE